jgi:hypothetical protein
MIARLKDRLLLPVTGLVIVGLVAAGARAGRPTSRSGGVGDTLQAKTVSARLIEVKAGPQYSVDVGVCNKQDAAIIAWDFQLVLDDGTKLHPAFATGAHEFDGTREGCAQGWIRYDVPHGSKPEKLDYRYDGPNGRSQYQNRTSGGNQEHDRFSWSL